MKMKVPCAAFLLKKMSVAAPLVTERKILSGPEVNKPKPRSKPIEKIARFHLGELEVERLRDHIVCACLSKQLRFLIRRRDIEGRSSLSENHGRVRKEAQDYYRKVGMFRPLAHSL